MTEHRAPYRLRPVPTVILYADVDPLDLARVPVVGRLESATKDGRQVCTATPSAFGYWRWRGQMLREASRARKAKANVKPR
jgi:hypothetical protein